MPRKLAVIAFTGIGLCIVCVGAAAVIDGPRLKAADWEKLSINFDRCETVEGATATTRTFDWNDDNRITISVPGTAHYHPGNGGDTVTATGDPQALAHLRVRHHHIEMDCDGSFGHDKLDITLPGRAFRSFTVAGSGKLDLDGLDQPSLDLTVAGSGNIKSSGKVDSAHIKIAGSGTIEASGSADNVDLKIAGSGDARLGELAAKMVNIDIAGSGNAEVAPQDEARIKIAGSGDVRLMTDPKDIDTKIFGSGRIIHGGAR